MNWKKYKVTYYIPNSFIFEREWDYYIVEALSSREAIKMGKDIYRKEMSNCFLNRPPIENVKFLATLKAI